MPDCDTLNNDLFAIHRKDDRYYLYAPLQRCLAVVNRAAVSAVAQFLESGRESLTPTAKTIIETLQEKGFFGAAAITPMFPDTCDFCPNEVTLFPTSRCNLRCRYCYADAGKKSVDMPWEIAKAAIDLTARNAGLLGSRKFAVGFHGGGEPTTAWALVVQSVEYARRKADEMGLDVEFFAATNGLLSDRQREFMAREFSSVNISLDGPEDIQNYNRPKADGNGSFEEVRDTLRYFDEKGLHYGVRSTITSPIVDRMEEIVEFLRLNFNLSYMHMEPAWLCGRCFSSGETPPADDAFVSNYLKAVQKGRQLGVNVTYSGARLNVLTTKFCAAPGDGFAVLPEGIVTSCFEVTDLTDPRAEIFHYGKYDDQSGSFQFDEERIGRLRKMSVENLQFCCDCFCKWHCAGDCLAKVFEKSRSTRHNGSIRCKLNRELTIASLDALLLEKEEPEERKAD